MRFSVFEEEISKLRHLLLHGEPKKALGFIKEIEKKKLSDMESDILKLMKAEALTRYGYDDKAAELIDLVLPKFLEKNSPKYYLQALIQKAWSLIGKSQPDEVIHLLKEKEKIFKKLSKEKLEEFFEERFGLLLTEGVAYYHKQNFKRYAKLAKECLELAENHNFKHGVGLALMNLGDSHARLGQSEKAQDFREESLRVFEELENPYWVAYVKHILGHSFVIIGDYDKAIEYYLEIMPFVEKTENAYQKIVILMHLASTYNQNIDQTIAKNYYSQAYQLLKKTDRLDAKKLVLENMISMSFDNGEMEKVDNYVKELKLILVQMKNPNMDLVMRGYVIRKVMNDFYESNSPRIREESEKLIREFIKDASSRDFHTRGFKIHLCSLLLLEYLDTGNNELIDEIELITTELLESSKSQGKDIQRIAILFYRLIALWFRSKILGDKEKSEEIQQLLSKTEEYAGVKGNKLLLKYMKISHEFYASQIEELEEIVEKYIESN